MPAWVAYAAALADVLPVEAQMTAFAPCSTAFETAIVVPRSLKEPVGFIPSNFTQTRAPVRDEKGGCGDERGSALAERDDRRRLGDVEPIGILAEDSAPLVRHRCCSPSTRRVDWTLVTAGFTASASTVEASDGFGRLVGDDDQRSRRRVGVSGALPA